MGNCFVKKLKGNVSDNTLPKFGFTRLEIEGRGNNRGTYFNIQGSHVMAEIYVYDKNFNILDHKTFASQYTLGDINRGDKKYVDIKTINFTRFWSQAGVQNELSDLKYCTNLSILDLRYGSIKGSIESLITLTNLTAINFTGSPYPTGTVESLVEGQFNVGSRRNGSIAFVGNDSITFHGSPYYGTITFENSSVSVADSNGNVLGTYNGSTWSYS